MSLCTCTVPFGEMTVHCVRPDGHSGLHRYEIDGTATFEAEAKKLKKISFDEYQAKALRTAHVGEPFIHKLTMAALGVAGEAGEVADQVKKTLFHSHPLDPHKLAEEAGDVLWYLSFLAHTLKMDFSEIAEMNIKKLLKRYPEGFDPERSKNRKEG